MHTADPPCTHIHRHSSQQTHTRHPRPLSDQCRFKWNLLLDGAMGSSRGTSLLRCSTTLVKQVRVCVCKCVCVCECVRACVRVCVCVRARAGTRLV
jgi:hypothetical protein